MKIRAKYQSRCPACDSTINVGDEVEWSKGTKAVHAACAPGGKDPNAYGPTVQTDHDTPSVSVFHDIDDDIPF